MSLGAKTILITLSAILFVAASIIPFRWFLLNDTELERGQALASKGMNELRSLKDEVDTFEMVVLNLENDEKLQKDYYEKKIEYNNEFGRETVENIEQVLKTLYEGDAFFELTSLSIVHQSKQNKTSEIQKPKIQFLIDGKKRLIKQ